MAHKWSRGIALLFLDHGTRRGWGVSVTPGPLFNPGKDPVPIVQEAGWAPMAGLDRCGKSRPPPGFDPWTIQSIASRYTDYATRPIDVMCCHKFMPSEDDHGLCVQWKLQVNVSYMWIIYRKWLSLFRCTILSLPSARSQVWVRSATCGVCV